MKKLLALLFAFGLIAAACGSTASEVVDAAEDAVDEAADAVDGEEEEAMEDDGAAELATIDEINVAYFQGWPLPPQIGQNDGTFAAAVGAETLNWVPFPDGGSMADAMIAGDIDISYSIGLTPFAVKATDGAPISMISIAVGYADADNCIVSSELDYSRDNAADTLAGATIMTPIGNITHYKLLNTLEFLGLSDADVEILPHESGDATAAAFAAGQIDVGCAFGGPLVTMEEAGGVPLLTGTEVTEEVGIATYDVNAVTNDFAAENPEIVSQFVAAVDQFNNTWASDPDTYNPVIAEAAGMEEVGNFLSGPTWFSFPTIDEQLSDAWLGDSVATVMLEQMTFFQEQGQIENVADDYAQFIDTSFLEAAAG